MTSTSSSVLDRLSPVDFDSQFGDDDYEDVEELEVNHDIAIPDVVDATQLPHTSVFSRFNPIFNASNLVANDNREGPNLDLDLPSHHASGDELTDAEKSARLESLLDGASEQINATNAGPEPGAQTSVTAGNPKVTIKQEEPEAQFVWEEPMPSEPIDLCDSDNDIEDISRRDPGFRYGRTIDNGVIMLSDAEEEQEVTIVYDDGTTAVTVKQENADVEIMGANMGIVDVSELYHENDKPPLRRRNLGSLRQRNVDPRPQRTPAELAAMRQAQRRLASRSLGGQNVTDIRNIAQLSTTLQVPDSNITGNDNGFDWMTRTCTAIPDADPSSNFKELKKAYKVKCKARKNTLDDDVTFKKALQEERERVRRIMEEAYATGSEAEDSDSELFVRQNASILKRPFGHHLDDDANAGDADKDMPIVQSPQAKKQKGPACKGQVDWSNKKSRTAYLSKELRSNMLAGIEAYLLRGQKRREEETAKGAESAGVGTGKAAKRGRKLKSAKADLPTRTEIGRMNNVNSLLTSNVYDDSNANLGSTDLPVLSAKNKKEFLSNLIANVPLEDQKQARSDKIDVVRASKILHLHNVKPNGEGNWKMKGMDTSLFHYQVQGAAYMKKRETGDQSPYGGILADQMGLGKTVMMIANIIANRPKHVNEPKCTLIVCSPALMTQWERELQTHGSDGIFKRMSRHHAHTRFSGPGAERDMENADVILTTYGEVVRSYPKCQVPKELKTAAEQEAWWLREWEENRDLLHRAVFYRIVLDEAQVIKNHASQTSIACRALMARHRWAMSGTPIQNRLEELFPYFKFLRVRHTGSLSVFRQNFCAPGSDVCNKRLHSSLDSVMIRRTYQTRLFGAPLIILPKNTQETLELIFNDVEMKIYLIVEKCCIRDINAFAKDGTEEEQTRMLMTYFQRLRQMVSHIFMVQEVLEREWKSVWPIDTMIAELQGRYNEKSHGMKMLRSLRDMIEVKGEVPEDEQEADIVPPVEQDPKKLRVTKPGTLTSKFGSYLTKLKRKQNWTELHKRISCQKCNEPAEEPLVIDCLHLYCRECLESMAYEAASQGNERTACMTCGTVFKEAQSCDDLKQLKFADLSISMFQKQEEKKPKKFKLKMNWVDRNDELVLSTKLIAVKKQLEKWTSEEPECKIIVFTEWYMVMHLLGRICQQQKWKCCHYNGKMNHSTRDRAINAFQDDKDLKIMIASLKCGGTGLNLTAASKVICLDLWFNGYVEEQAFCRVHRIGQKSETYITRFYVKGTVDERLLEMQREKREIITAAIDDDTVLPKLTLEELMSLFGPVHHDEESKPFILVDDEDQQSQMWSRFGRGATEMPQR